MGESAMKFKVKRASWWVYNLWKSNAFGYFDHPGKGRKSALHKADGSMHHSRGDPPWQMVASMWTTSKASGVFLGALADLCRNRTGKQPKGQSVFFLVDHGHPEMLPAVKAEELREMREGTML